MDNVISLTPYWDKIVDYYWANLDPATDGSIWQYLEREYHGVRVRHHVKPSSLQSSLLFKQESDMTLFLLRWA